jgi:hypothetical protein
MRYAAGLPQIMIDLSSPSNSPSIRPIINLTNYVIDLQKRFEQFNKLIYLPSYQNLGVWFVGLLFPEAYMTATRQFVAQRNGWSLEEL